MKIFYSFLAFVIFYSFTFIHKISTDFLTLQLSVIWISLYIFWKKTIDYNQDHSNVMHLQNRLSIIFLTLLLWIWLIHIFLRLEWITDNNFIILISHFLDLNKYSLLILSTSIWTLLFSLYQNQLNNKNFDLLFKINKNKGVFSKHKLRKYIPIIIFIVALIIGIYFRVINIWLASPENDEGYMLMAIKWLDNHFPLPIMADGYTYIQWAPLTYSAYFLYSIFNIDPLVSIRLISALSGILLILFTYIIWNKLFNTKVALFASVLISLSLWDIEYARRWRYYSLNILLYITSCYYLYLFYINNKYKYLIIFFILSIIAFLNHLQSVILFGIFWVVIILKLVKERKYKPILYYTFFTIILFLLLMFSVGYVKDWTTNILEVLTRLANKLDFSSSFLDFFLTKTPLIAIGLIFWLIFLFNNYKNYKIIFIAIITFFPIIFISFYHLSSAQRYIYYGTMVPQVIFVAWFYILHQHMKKIYFYSVLCTIILSWLCYYTIWIYSINNRLVWDIYYEWNFRPTPYSQNKIPWVSNAFKKLESEFSLYKADELPSLITTRFDIFYYYMNREPNYYLKLWTQDFWINEDGTVPFMKKTLLISDELWLFNTIRENKISYIIMDKVIIKTKDIIHLDYLYKKIKDNPHFSFVKVYSDLWWELYKITNETYNEKK